VSYHQIQVFATYLQRLTRIVGWDDAEISGGRGEGSSRAMLATARPSCKITLLVSRFMFELFRDNTVISLFLNIRRTQALLMTPMSTSMHSTVKRTAFYV